MHAKAGMTSVSESCMTTRTGSAPIASLANPIFSMDDTNPSYSAHAGPIYKRVSLLFKTIDCFKCKSKPLAAFGTEMTCATFMHTQHILGEMQESSRARDPLSFLMKPIISNVKCWFPYQSLLVLVSSPPLVVRL